MYRRAPFIWTAKQSIDAGGLFRFFLGGPARRDDGVNRWLLFRRAFRLPASPETARLTTTVDGRYQLFVNGRRVGRGPARCDPLHQRTDTYDIAAALQSGENVIGLLVHVYGVDTAWYQTANGHWQPVFGDGALYCDAEIQCGSIGVDILSDTHWRCLECSAWERDTPRVNWGLGFVEVHDARAMPVDWSEPGFDDSGWDDVHVLTSGGGPPDAPMGGMQIEPFPTLLAREIPFLEESAVAPATILRWYAVTPRSDLPVDRRLYEEELEPLPAGLVERPDALLVASDDTTLVRTNATSDVGLLLDFGRIHSGHPFIELDAVGGESIEIAAAEGIPGEWDADKPLLPRIDRERAHGAHLFRYIARPGPQRFERFEWTAVRYLQVAIRNAPGGLRIRHIGSTFTHYPAEPRGAFECSDALLNRLWDIGRYTLQLCMHDGWEDCPSREQRQWLGDATVEFLVGQAAFGPSINALNRQFLQHAAESQRPDGLTQMFAPGDHHVDALLIPDWTLQWILNAHLHWLYTGDLDVVEAIFPAVQRALAWFERQLGPNGLVADLPYWHFMDWAAFGRHGEAAALNALLAGALRGAAQLATALEGPRIARHYETLAGQIAAALNTRHWDARRGVYVDTVDAATGMQDARVSQHTNAALVLWEIAPRARWDAMLDYITDPARMVFTAAPPIAPTGAAIDPEKDVVRANTFFSHFVYGALCRAGRFDRALTLIREHYGQMITRGATTLWESFEPTASLCHGFSATPVYQLSTEVLGIYPLAPGFACFRFSPQPVDLAYARGIFPTVHGDVRVAWRRDHESIDVELTVPEGTQAQVVPPPAYRLTVGSPEFGAGGHRLRFGRTPA